MPMLERASLWCRKHNLPQFRQNNQVYFSHVPMNSKGVPHTVRALLAAIRPDPHVTNNNSNY
jgi:hypothetical protein